jgi:hypothetical protein
LDLQRSDCGFQEESAPYADSSVMLSSGFISGMIKSMKEESSFIQKGFRKKYLFSVITVEEPVNEVFQWMK